MFVHVRDNWEAYILLYSIFKKTPVFSHELTPHIFLKIENQSKKKKKKKTTTKACITVLLDISNCINIYCIVQAVSFSKYNHNSMDLGPYSLTLYFMEK